VTEGPSAKNRCLASSATEKKGVPAKKEKKELLSKSATPEFALLRKKEALLN